MLSEHGRPFGSFNLPPLVHFGDSFKQNLIPWHRHEDAILSQGFPDRMSLFPGVCNNPDPNDGTPAILPNTEVRQPLSPRPDDASRYSIDTTTQNDRNMLPALITRENIGTVRDDAQTSLLGQIPKESNFVQALRGSPSDRASENRMDIVHLLSK
jgi:hypothetical protein